MFRSVPQQSPSPTLCREGELTKVGVNSQNPCQKDFECNGDFATVIERAETAL
jgi:hypothetical protein